ncbi:MAG: hypothetical protein M1837_002793 [Sclerophora amabilis]|nr:MAG: hypothetical protein M1837_002793 [Sclerophora amabilis]
MAQVTNLEKGVADHVVAVDDKDLKVKNVQNVALADATSKQRPSPWTRNMLQLYGCLLVATLNSCINGYDGSLMGSINSYPQYREYFGFDPTAGTPATGIVYAIYTIGNLVGSFAAGPATDYRGRRVGMFLGCLTIIIGTCVQATSTVIGQFMAGRFLLGFGVAICASAGPTYVAEMAHPSYRGIMTAVYNTFWFVGGIPGTFVPYGTRNIVGQDSWRIPVWLQMVFSGLVLLSCLFLPETPRWLMANDRHEEALVVMAKYHGEGDRESPIVKLEFREMMDDISITGADKRWWDYRELFNSREVRYRSMLVISMGFFGQWVGNGPVSYYYPQMIAGAGISSISTQLLLQGLQNIVSLAGAIFGTTFTDKWGRRPGLLVSTGIMVAIFAMITALNATNLDIGPDGAPVAKRPSQAKAQIAIIFIFGFVYAAGYTPLQALYPVEVLRYESRAKGMGMYNFWVNIASFYNTFVTGIAFTESGWKYYFLFIFFDIFVFCFIYFFYVETKGRTLEELSEIFNERRPVKKSLEKSEVVMNGQAGVTEVLGKGSRV